ncbi:MAG: hypothetical protein OSA99_15050 [Acidimicrobiales bacterium]|nr:hypothetical protein [Acidimicrobiales bacterium]
MAHEELDEAPGWAKARGVVLAILSIEVVVLVVSGVALCFVYRPSAAQAWDDIYELHLDGGLSGEMLLSQRVRSAHRLASVAAVPTALIAAVVHTVGARPPLRGAAGIVGAVALAAVALLASVTGFLLPWDQLALWAVTVGEEVGGYGFLFDDDVRFVLIGGVEVTPGTLLGWLVAHVALGAVSVALVGALWSAGRRSRI